jgi:hypothetical protein
MAQPRVGGAATLVDVGEHEGRGFRAPQADRAEQVQQREVALALAGAAVGHLQQPRELFVRQRARLAPGDAGRADRAHVGKRVYANIHARDPLDRVDEVALTFGVTPLAAAVTTARRGLLQPRDADERRTDVAPGAPVLVLQVVDERHERSSEREPSTDDRQANAP